VRQLLANALRRSMGTMKNAGSNAGSSHPTAQPSLNGGQGGSDFAERRADFGTEGRNGDDADHRDQADKHTIFDQGRALVVTAEAID